MKLSSKELRTVCRPVRQDEDVGELVEGMLEIVGKCNAYGLAANQVGKTVRVIVANQRAMVNPVVTRCNTTCKVEVEACLSLPYERVPMKRPTKIWVVYRDLEGEQRTLKARGQLARVILHEIEHLDGKLITDYKGVWKER
jgi:peptide deformylase